MDNEVRLVLSRVGKSQIDAMFARQDDGPAIDDEDFLPLLEIVLTAFEATVGGHAAVEELWKHAYAVYGLDWLSCELSANTNLS
ncbi:MAG: hypothetical protein ABGZ53_08735 [Fuerstiella sp.]